MKGRNMSVSLAIIDTKKAIADNNNFLFKEVFAKGATNTELSLFSEICKQRNLNPLFRQIYFIKIWDSSQQKDVMSPVVSVDGFRAIANRTGLYKGQTLPQFCGKDGIWKEIWTSDEPPFAAKVGIYRKGFKEPVYHIAEWRSFAKYTKDGKLTQFWKKFGTLMLAKCAEIGGFRKAFPEDLSGLYVQEEMEQSSRDDVVKTIFAEERPNDLIVEDMMHDNDKSNIPSIKDPPTPKEENKLTELQKTQLTTLVNQSTLSLEFKDENEKLDFRRKLYIKSRDKFLSLKLDSFISLDIREIIDKMIERVMEEDKKT